jgi:hypothetical protein
MVGVLAVASAPVEAVSTPVIAGQVSGLELCPQSICGQAIFVGIFAGRVGVNPFAIGIMVVAVNHEPLPGPLASADITGGAWELAVGLRRFRGGVEGTLFNNANETYTVDTTLPVAQGGFGSLEFQGLLDHNVFPPTIRGTITQ